MKKILNILKKSFLSIFIVIILLIIQARCDLALPDYTANIVNVGIGQSGISDNVLEVVRESEMKKILLFTDADEKILSNYILIVKNDSKYTKKYPILKDENIYILDNIGKESREKLNEYLRQPLVLVSTFQNKNEITEKIYSEYNISDEVSLLDIFYNMTDEQLELTLKDIKKTFSDFPDSLVSQMGIAYIKNEYKIIGLNLEKMQINYIVNAGIKMLGIALLIMIITIITSYLSSKIGAKFSKQLRSEVVNKVMSFSNKEFEEISTASLITRSTNDVNQVQMLIIMLLRMIIYAPILGFGALSKVSGNSLSWVIAVAVLAIISLVIILFSFALPKFKVVQKFFDKINLVSRETLSGIPVIRAFANEKHEEKRFDDANKDLTKLNIFVSRLMSIMMPTMMFIMNGVSILIIWVGASKIDIGEMQVGDLMAFITYTMQIIMSFLMISMMSIILPRSWVSIKRIAEIFNKKASVIEKNELVKFDKNIKGLIEFKDVYFRYPDAEEDVLQNISFKVLPGTTTAFIGSTGSGKSTLINLIPRFYDVTGGKILIDGVNIKDVSLHDLREKIGFVPQKGMLFTGTIESNIKFGSDMISDEEVKKAAKIAQALDFIEEKKDKFQSEISQGGSNVSGGQKQRLAIARAIATNPEIYIFDDSFSALDYKTESRLRKVLKKETKGSTVLIVAQRISTVLSADQIVVLDQGKIVGIGTHQELMNSCDIYKEIALSQLSKEELTHE